MESKVFVVTSWDPQGMESQGFETEISVSKRNSRVSKRNFDVSEMANLKSISAQQTSKLILELQQWSRVCNPFIKRIV